MLVGSWGNVVQSRGVSTAEALNTRSGTFHTPHLLPVRVFGDKDGDRDSNPSSLIRPGVGRWTTPTSRTGHLGRFRPDLPTDCLETMGARSTRCARRRWRILQTF